MRHESEILHLNDAAQEETSQVPMKIQSAWKKSIREPLFFYNICTILTLLK